MPGLGVLLRRYAPHDTYTIWKVGDKLRVDGSLMGLDTKSVVPEWKRGHFSLIVDGSPEGVAAAAAAAEEALAASNRAAKQKQLQQRHEQSWRQQEQAPRAGEQQQSADGGSLSPAPAPATPPAAAQAACNQADSSSSSSSRGGRQQDVAAGGCSSSSSGQQQQHQQQEFFDPLPSPAGLGGPRLLFLNHTKSSWVDLSADKKALKLETDAEAAELNSELIAAMER